MTLCLLYVFCLTLISFFTLFITDHTAPALKITADDLSENPPERPPFEEQNSRIVHIGSRVERSGKPKTGKHTAKRREMTAQAPV